MFRLRYLFGSALALAGTLVLIPAGLFALVSGLMLVFELATQPVAFLREVSEVTNMSAGAALLFFAATALLGIAALAGMTAVIWAGVRLRGEGGLWRTR